jgi:hypothetical protein
LAILILGIALALFLSRGDEHLVGRLLYGMCVMGLAILGGTAIFLFIGYSQTNAGGDLCAFCKRMHIANLVTLALVAGVVWVGWQREFFHSLEMLEVTIGAVLGLVVFVTTVVALHGFYQLRYENYRSQSVEQERVIAMLGQTAPPPPCPTQLVQQDLTRLPGAHESLTLAAPTSGASGPWFVEVLDTECDHCKATHKHMKDNLRGWVADPRIGVKLVLYSKSKACNPSHEQPEDKVRSCRGNAAAYCAYEQAPAKIQEFLNWYFFTASPATNRPSLKKVRAWLRGNIGDAALGCFERENANLNGALAEHGRYYKEMGQALVSDTDHASRRCVEFVDEQERAHKPWWCFTGTPTMVVFRDTPPSASSDNPHLVRVGTAARAPYLEACLE